VGFLPLAFSRSLTAWVTISGISSTGASRHDPSARRATRRRFSRSIGKIDGGWGALLKRIDGDTHVLVDADHGMGPFLCWRPPAAIGPRSPRMSGAVTHESESSIVERPVWNIRHLLPAPVRRRVKKAGCRGWASGLWPPNPSRAEPMAARARVHGSRPQHDERDPDQSAGTRARGNRPARRRKQLFAAS